MKNACLPTSWRPVDSGCDIRLGAASDGGYVIPQNVLDDVRVVVSLGVNLDWSFETELLEKAPNVNVWSYDYTTRFSYILWWAATRFFASPLTREPRHLSAWRKPISYLFYRWSPRVKHRAKFVRMTPGSDSVPPVEVVSSLPTHTPTLIKMDIEGGEYDVYKSLVFNNRDIVAVAMELHHVGKDDRAWDLVDRLLEHFTITYVHANNAGRLSNENVPEFVELTFVRNDYAGAYVRSSAEPYLHPLSKPNLTDKPDHPIAFSIP